MSEPFISTAPVLELCGRCKGWIYTAQVMGFGRKVEPTPLNLLDEVKARLAGRKVFQTFGTTNPILISRSAWHITKGDKNAIVLASHDCNQPTYFEPAPLYEKPMTTDYEGVPF